MTITTVEYDNRSIESITYLIAQLNLQVQELQDEIITNKKIFAPQLQLMDLLKNYINNSIKMIPHELIQFSKLHKHFNFITDLKLSQQQTVAFVRHLQAGVAEREPCRDKFAVVSAFSVTSQCKMLCHGLVLSTCVLLGASH